LVPSGLTTLRGLLAVNALSAVAVLTLPNASMRPTTRATVALALAGASVVVAVSAQQLGCSGRAGSNGPGSPPDFPPKPIRVSWLWLFLANRS
jgi:hypothetical protein